MKEREEEGGMKRVRREGEREKRGNKKKKKRKTLPIPYYLQKCPFKKKKKLYIFSELYCYRIFRIRTFSDRVRGDHRVWKTFCI